MSTTKSLIQSFFVKLLTLVLLFGFGNIWLTSSSGVVAAAMELDLTAGKVVLTASGSGAGETPVFEATEGPLKVKITHQTENVNSYFGVNFQSDANLDGEFCSTQEYCNLLIQAGYEAIQDFDETAEWSSFIGGKGKFTVDAPGDWQITVTQYPIPKHTISGNIRAALPKNPDIMVVADKVNVVATSSGGQVYETMTNYVGDYSLKVYGYTDYTIVASLPDFESETATITRADLLALENQVWPIKQNFDLNLAITTSDLAKSTGSTDSDVAGLLYDNYLLVGIVVLLVIIVLIIYIKRKKS